MEKWFLRNIASCIRKRNCAQNGKIQKTTDKNNAESVHQYNHVSGGLRLNINETRNEKRNDKIDDRCAALTFYCARLHECVRIRMNVQIKRPRLIWLRLGNIKSLFLYMRNISMISWRTAEQQNDANAIQKKS